jgi:hypothetical protein
VSFQASVIKTHPGSLQSSLSQKVAHSDWDYHILMSTLTRRILWYQGTIFHHTGWHSRSYKNIREPHKHIRGLHVACGLITPSLHHMALTLQFIICVITDFSVLHTAPNIQCSYATNLNAVNLLVMLRIPYIGCCSEL